MIKEVWKTIPQFSNYNISNYGRIYNLKSNHLMRTSFTSFGNVKITLKSDRTSLRYTRSVARMVAEAFVSPPNRLCDHVVILDGDFTNLSSENLVWRPRWFAWKYSRQLKVPTPLFFQEVPVINLNTGDKYESIVAAGITEGVLFEDIWRSTRTGSKVYPYGFKFEILR